MAQTIDFRELGCIQQSVEFYEDLEAKFVSLDELDKSRVILNFMTKLLSNTTQIHPLVIMKLMENIQNIEISAAKIKQLLGDVKVNSLTCKKCGKCVPEMTMLMFCQGINAECPHDQIEVNITDISS